MITKYYKFTNPEGYFDNYPNMHTLDYESFFCYQNEDKSEGVVMINIEEAMLEDWLANQHLTLQEINETEFLVYRDSTPLGKVRWEGVKEVRDEDLAKSVITYKELQFDADEAAMDRFNRLISLANAKFNLTSDPTVYETTIAWKTRDNQFHSITVKDMIAIQEQCLLNLQNIWETRV